MSAVPPPRPRAAMLSRVAHSLYWMSRYIERAENLARLLEVNLQFLVDFSGFGDVALQEHWGSILASAGDASLFAAHYAGTDSRSVTEFLALDARHPGSILSCVNAARENARMVRDQISLEMWETINALYLFLRGRNADDVWRGGPYDFLEEIKRHSHLFQGLTDATYSRSEGWEFIQFGKWIERADKATRLLDLKYHILLPNAADVGGAVDTAQWQAVLRSASALEAYHRFYVQEILPWKVAEFLIFSDSFPRSLHRCVLEMDTILRQVLREDGTRPPAAGAASSASKSLLGLLQSAGIEQVLEQGLHEFLLAAQRTLTQIGDEVVQAIMAPPGEMADPEEQQQQQQ